MLSYLYPLELFNIVLIIYAHPVTQGKQFVLEKIDAIFHTL